MTISRAFALVFSLFLLAAGTLAIAQPANDDIADAVDLIGDPINISGTTSAATDDVPDAGTSFCGTAITTGGVWYRVYGDGGDITADTCGGGTNYDSKLSVFSGSPGSLSCISGNDDFCGLSSSVTWTANNGEPYYLLVHGFGSAQGDFDLSVTGAGDGSVELAPVPVLPAWLLIGLVGMLLGYGSYRVKRRG